MDCEHTRLRDGFDLVLDALADAALASYGRRLVSIVVYGSVGRGTPRHDSDVDVLVVAEDLPKGRLARMKEFGAVERRLDPLLVDLKSRGLHTSLSPVFKTPEEVLRGSLLFLDIVDDGLILYDRGEFMRSYLVRLVERLARLGSRKIVRGNSWHWVIKPDYQEGEVFEI